MAEKEFKIQNGLRVLEEAYFQSDVEITGNIILGNTIVNSNSFPIGASVSENSISVFLLMGA